MSNFPSRPTRNITSHSKENLAFHSLLRWKMITIQILATSRMHFLFKRLGEYIPIIATLCWLLILRLWHYHRWHNTVRQCLNLHFPLSAYQSTYGVRRAKQNPRQSRWAKWSVKSPLAINYLTEWNHQDKAESFSSREHYHHATASSQKAMCTTSILWMEDRWMIDGHGRMDVYVTATHTRHHDPHERGNTTSNNLPKMVRVTRLVILALGDLSLAILSMLLPMEWHSVVVCRDKEV